MEINFKHLRVSADYLVYPPYHKGDYLEEYFYKYYLRNKEEFDSVNFTLIPVFWTNVYITGKNRNLLQPYIDSLPKNVRYFTVSQHDDAIQEKLPPNTLSFTAGGRAGGIPIPLICSPIPEEYTSKTNTKDISCSFVGTISTVSGLRQKMYHTLQNTPGFYFSEPQWWSPTITENKFKEFIDITQRSWFSLAPRGYGLQSFRFYEILQLGSIPIFVYDNKWQPFENFIDWSVFSLSVHIDNISSVPDMINSYTTEQKVELIKTGHKVYKEFFTLEKTCNYILKSLKIKNES
jgi:hypothetical protein